MSVTPRRLTKLPLENHLGRNLSKNTQYNRSNLEDNMQTKRSIQASGDRYIDWSNPGDTINVKDVAMAVEGIDHAKN